MDGGAKLVEHDVFKKRILHERDRFLELSMENIQNIDEKVLEKLKKLYEDFTIMASSKKIVGNSKLFHHILPNLIPPIDGGHTLPFFDYNNDNNPVIFIEIIKKFSFIANKINWNDIEQDNNFNTSIPKIIDNAIMGYVKYYKTSSNKL